MRNVSGGFFGLYSFHAAIVWTQVRNSMAKQLVLLGRIVWCSTASSVWCSGVVFQARSDVLVGLLSAMAAVRWSGGLIVGNGSGQVVCWVSGLQRECSDGLAVQRIAFILTL